MFDKRAVDKGQVQFFDIAYVEAKPNYARGRNTKDKLTLAIELSEFSVHYTQGAADAAAAALKDGKSAVVCDDGQLYKLTKKDGVITRERLTKTWTDWVDYWAVDFNYMSRKEIIKVPRGMGVEDSLPGTEPVAGRTGRVRGALDRRLHLRERVAKLSHAAAARARTEDVRAHLPIGRAATRWR